MDMKRVQGNLLLCNARPCLNCTKKSIIKFWNSSSESAEENNVDYWKVHSLY